MFCVIANPYNDPIILDLNIFAPHPLYILPQFVFWTSVESSNLIIPVKGSQTEFKDMEFFEIEFSESEESRLLTKLIMNILSKK
jgi:hypothetical protein